MDKKELLILSTLRKDSRRSLTTMRKEINLPISTIHEKIKDYRNNIIKKTTAILDFGKLGFKTKAQLLLKSELSTKSQLLDYLKKSPHVNTLTKINNGYDYYAEIIFTDMIEAENFVEELSIKFPLQKTKIFYTLEDIKREEFLCT